MNFSDLGLNPRICSALESLGYTQPTPVQQQAIPPVMEGRDIMASAQTGTGKTAAFVVPSLHRIIAGPSAVTSGRGPRMLVLTPTRELAMQVLENVKSAGKNVSISTGVMVGGVSYGPQINLLRNKLDVLVSTPGRLIDHMNEGRVDLSRVEILVLDEADKMLDMGFLKPVEKVLSAIQVAAKRPQILLFSATFTKSVEQFATRYLQKPARVELAPKKASNAQITQRVYRVDSTEHKHELLQHFLKEANGERVLVFSATKYGSEKLAKRLTQAGYKAEPLHGGMKQNLRKRTLDKMHTGHVQVLVATDVAARGIDVKQLGHVINFDLPQVAEDYVHRIGRTGRAGETGVALSFVAPEDYPMLKDIEKVLGKPVEYLTLPGFEPILEMHEFNRLGAAAPRSRQQKRTGGGAGRSGGAAASSSRGGSSQGGQKSFGQRSSSQGQGGFKSGSSKPGQRAGGRSSFSGNGGSSGGASAAKRPRRFGSK